MPIERIHGKIVTSILRTFLGSRRSAPFLPRELKSILVIRQHNQLGDMLCVVPLLRALRERFPGSKISLIASPVNQEVMQHHRYIDELIVYDKGTFLGRRSVRVREIVAFVRALRAHRFQLAIVPSTVSISVTSGLLAYLSGAPIRIGPGSIDGRRNPSGFFFNQPVVLDWRSTPHRHQTLRNLDNAGPLSLSIEDLSAEVTLTKNELIDGRLFVQARLAEERAGICFHPGAGKAPNRWPAGNFAKVANMLAHDPGASIFITSGPMDDRPESQMISRLTTDYELIKNKPLRFVASILCELQLVITNDTGIMHVAAAVGVPVLSLFGPTDPRQWAPIGPKNRYLVGEGGDIQGITVDDVYASAREMLADVQG